MADVETDERSDAPEEGARRSPRVVAIVAFVLVGIAALAWWSGRVEIVVVPNVVGQHVDAATLEPVISLLEQELVVGDISTDACPELTQPDTVVAQVPAGGSEVPFGTSVDLVICRE